MDRYQSAFHPGRTDVGERDCAERWDLIAEHIPSRGVLLDVGSNLGYFGLRAVHEHADLAVISIESDPLIAARQARLIDANAADRIALLQGTISAAACEQWAETCDAVETTLLLAVVHWLDDPVRAVAALASMSGRLVVEVPHPDDVGACGQDKLRLWDDPVAWFGATTGRSARIIGRMARHTSEVPSYVVLVDGPVERTPRVGYWGSPVEVEPGRYRIRQEDGVTELWVRGERRDVIPGVNLVNLMHLGALVRPRPPAWRQGFERALAAAPRHEDPLPHNALWTAHGLVLIDDEPRDALTTPSDGLRVLDRNLPKWVSGETTSGDVEIRTLTRLQRWRRAGVAQTVSRRIPTPLKHAIRRQLHRLSERRRMARSSRRPHRAGKADDPPDL